jgi:hypothetical protein
MSSPTTPPSAFPDQFDELSRALFLRFQQAARQRLAAGRSKPISVLRYEDTLLKLAPPACKEKRRQALHAH